MSVVTQSDNPQNPNSASVTGHRIFSFVKRFDLTGADTTGLTYDIPIFNEHFLKLHKIRIGFVSALNVAGVNFTDSNDYSGYFSFNLLDSSTLKIFNKFVFPIEKDFVFSEFVAFDSNVFQGDLRVTIPGTSLIFNAAGTIAAYPPYTSMDLVIELTVIDFPKNQYEISERGISPRKGIVNK